MILPDEDKHKGNRVLDDLKFIHQKDASDVLGATARRLIGSGGFIAESVVQWLPDVAAARNPAKQLAHELLGRAVVIYAGPELYPVAEAWKEKCNLHARQLAWCARIDRESELLSWTGQPIDRPYVVVELHSNLEGQRVQQFFAVAERQLSGMRPAPIVVEVEGHTLDEQRQWAAAYGEFVAIYLGLLNGFDPSGAAMLEKFKKELNT